MRKFKILVRRRGTQEIAYQETFQTDDDKVAEYKASNIWNSQRFDNQPDRFRLYLYEKGISKSIMTIG